MRLLGIDPYQLRDDERSLMTARLNERRDIRWLELLSLVSAITDAAAIMTGSGSNRKAPELLRQLKDILYPDGKTDRSEQAKRVEEMLKAEAERGPMKVKAMAEPTKRKRQPRGQRRR